MSSQTVKRWRQKCQSHRMRTCSQHFIQPAHLCCAMFSFVCFLHPLCLSVIQSIVSTGESRGLWQTSEYALVYKNNHTFSTLTNDDEVRYYFSILLNNSQNRIASLSWSQCIQVQSSNRRYKAAVKLDLGQCRSHWDISIKLPVRSPIIKCIKYVLCHLQRAGNTSTKLSHYSQSYVIWYFIDVIWPLDGSVD